MQNPWKDIVPYTKEDAAHFKGRDVDIRKFARILQYSDFSVLYAESGIGKTSFINAGIIPVFAASNYKDVIIHIPTEIYRTPAEQFREKFEQLLCECVFEKTDLREVAMDDCSNPEVQDDLRKSLWWRLHAYTYKITLNEQEQIVWPFIIFDQFEEVFQKASPEILNELFRVLADLSSKMPPSDLMGKLKTYDLDELYDQIDNDIHFKVLFSLRKEYLAEFDHWTNTRHSIPEMLQNRMLLQSFTKEQAEDVITKQVLNGNAVHTLDLVKDNILSLFERRNAEEPSNIVKQNAGYEAFLLSVICSRLYDFAQAKGIAQVTPKEMEGFNISSLILNFYETSIRDLSIPRQHLKVIEEELVDEWGDRNRIKANTRNLTSIQFEKRYRKGLEDKHIIKNSDGYVELIHDRVAEAIFYKRKEVNKHQWAWLQRGALAVLIVLMSYAAIYSGWITTNPQGYVSRELRTRDELKLPEDNDYYTDKSKQFVAKLTIDNDDVNVSQERISDLANLTDLKITGRKASPTKIMVSDCNKLVNLSLSDSLTSFPQVSNCPNLHFLRLPANVESFPGSDFLDGMDSVEFAIPEKTPASEKYVWQDGILWSIADTRIIYAQANADTVLCFPDEIHADRLEYRGRTFSQPKNKKPDLFIKERELVSVKLYDNTTLDLTQPQYDTIETIGKAVFRNCKKLQAVKLPSKLKRIESSAFAGCTALSEIKFPNSTSVWVEDYAFAGCHRLKRVYLSQDSNFEPFFYSPVAQKLFGHGRCNMYTQFDDCDSVTFVLPEANRSGKFRKDENGILWCDDEPIFFNEVSPTCNHEGSLLCIRNGIVYRRYVYGKIRPWSVSPKVNTEHSIDEQYGSTVVIIINADSTEYAPPASVILFRNSRELTELHLSNCNALQLPFLMLSDFAKSRITLYVPWGCRKYYEANPDYASFKEIREDGWWRRLDNLLTEMWQMTMSVTSNNPMFGYIGIGIVLLVLGVIYYRKSKDLLSRNSANRSRNVLRWQVALTAASAVFFFVLAWMAVYWLVFFNAGSFILSHILGLTFGALAVRIVVFNKTDYTALKRNIRDLFARVWHMTGQDWKQFFVDLMKALPAYFRSYIKKIVLFGSAIILIIIIASGFIWSQEVSEIIDHLDGNNKLESALYDKLSGRLMLLTPKQKGQLQDYYCRYDKIDTAYKVLDSIRGRDIKSLNLLRCASDGSCFVAVAPYDGNSAFLLNRSGIVTDTLNHAAEIGDISFCPNADRFVTIGGDKVLVWDKRGGKQDSLHHVGVTDVSFSADGERLISSSNREIRAWDQSGHLVDSLEKLNRSNIVYHLGAKRKIAVENADSLVFVYDLLKGDSLVLDPSRYMDGVESVCISPDGKHIATAIDCEDSYHVKAVVWSSTGTFERELKFGSFRPIGDISYSWNGRYVLGMMSGDCLIWDADSGMLLWRIDDDIIDIETAKAIDANHELTFVTREKDIKRVRLLSLKEMIEMRRQQLNAEI